MLNKYPQVISCVRDIIIAIIFYGNLHKSSLWKSASVNDTRM